MNIFWHIYAIQYYAKLKELVTTRFIIRLKKKICSNVHNRIYETFALNQNSMFVCTFGEHGEDVERYIRLFLLVTSVE